MASFDITAKVDAQTLDNAINVVKKEITNRYDFKGSHVIIDLDKKAMLLKLEVESDMKLAQLEEVLLSRSMRQGLDPKSFDLTKEHFSSGKIIKKEIPIHNGINQEAAKKIMKIIKDNAPKVQTAIMDDIIRVTSKKIDELQSIIDMLRTSSLDLPLQFVNMKR